MWIKKGKQKEQHFDLPLNAARALHKPGKRSGTDCFAYLPLNRPIEMMEVTRSKHWTKYAVWLDEDETFPYLLTISRDGTKAVFEKFDRS